MNQVSLTLRRFRSVISVCFSFGEVMNCCAFQRWPYLRNNVSLEVYRLLQCGFPVKTAFVCTLPVEPKKREKIPIPARGFPLMVASVRSPPPHLRSFHFHLKHDHVMSFFFFFLEFEARVERWVRHLSLSRWWNLATHHFPAFLLSLQSRLCFGGFTLVLYGDSKWLVKRQCQPPSLVVSSSAIGSSVPVALDLVTLCFIYGARWLYAPLGPVCPFSIWLSNCDDLTNTAAAQVANVSNPCLARRPDSGVSAPFLLFCSGSSQVLLNWASFAIFSPLDISLYPSLASQLSKKQIATVEEAQEREGKRGLYTARAHTHTLPRATTETSEFQQTLTINMKILHYS